MDYRECLEYINSFGRSEKNYNLNRMNKLLSILDNPHLKLKTIHVAGTNGKGSICAMLSQVLQLSGYRVGMFTSPYIEEFEERIQINRRNISKSDLIYYTEYLSKAIDKLISLGYKKPVFFEVVTCIMFLYFLDKNVDLAVIEVGLGGRFDPTNVIEPILCIIGSISYDHMEVLGDTLEKIAYDKGGIIKENTPVILYPNEDNVIKVIKEIAKEKNSELIIVDKSAIISFSDDYSSGFQYFNIETGLQNYNVKLNLIGQHQKLNCLTVIYALEKLNELGINIEKSQILKGFETVCWKGRMEILNKYPIVLIDGAHNYDAIVRLTDTLKYNFSYKKLVLIIGILSDKEVDKMLEVICPLASNIIAIEPKNLRSENTEIFALNIKKYNSNVEVFYDCVAAYEKALSICEDDDMILITGSLYLVGEMISALKSLSDNI